MKNYENDESSPSGSNRRRAYFGRGRSTWKTSWRKGRPKVAPRIRPRTIKQKAAGGKIVKVIREDDPDGKWNYEVFVKANGKESRFEVDPNGKFVKQHE